MNILAHRGYWKNESEKNSEIAFKRAWTEGFGIETDIRDFNGNIVISHDIADENSMSFDMFLDLYCQYGKETILAINIKSDGLQRYLKPALENFHITNYFIFDMSVPEQVIYMNQGFSVFSRQSELEPVPVLYEGAKGIWMDEFTKSWITDKQIKKHLDFGKSVGMISSEIHGRDYKKLWELLKKENMGQVILCTDLPKEAEEFFNGQN